MDEFFTEGNIHSQQLSELSQTRKNPNLSCLVSFIFCKPEYIFDLSLPYNLCKYKRNNCWRLWKHSLNITTINATHPISPRDTEVSFSALGCLETWEFCALKLQPWEENIPVCGKNQFLERKQFKNKCHFKKIFCENLLERWKIINVGACKTACPSTPKSNSEKLTTLTPEAFTGDSTALETTNLESTAYEAETKETIATEIITQEITTQEIAMPITTMEEPIPWDPITWRPITWKPITLEPKPNDWLTITYLPTSFEKPATKKRKPRPIFLEPLRMPKIALRT